MGRTVYCDTCDQLRTAAEAQACTHTVALCALRAFVESASPPALSLRAMELADVRNELALERARRELPELRHGTALRNEAFARQLREVEQLAELMTDNGVKRAVACELAVRCVFLDVARIDTTEGDDDEGGNDE